MVDIVCTTGLVLAGQHPSNGRVRASLQGGGEEPGCLPGDGLLAAKQQLSRALDALALPGREQAAPGVLLYLILVLDLRGAIRIDPEVEQQVGVRDLRLAQPDVLDHVEAVGDEAGGRPDAAG